MFSLSHNEVIFLEVMLSPLSYPSVLNLLLNHALIHFGVHVEGCAVFDCFSLFFLEENKCHPNPCRNGGICTEADGGYICTCMEGFKGLTCQGQFTLKTGHVDRLFLICTFLEA